MVHRLKTAPFLILLYAASFSTFAIEFEYIDRQTLNNIREAASKDVFGNKLNSGITREQSLVRALFRVKKNKVRDKNINLSPLPDIALFSKKSVPIKQAISLISRSINFNFLIDDDVDQSLKVVLSKRYSSIGDVLDNIEYQTNTVIHVFKDSRIIFVTKV